MVAFRSGHTLHAKFARALKEAIAKGGGKMVPTAAFVPKPEPVLGAPVKVTFEGGKEHFEQDDML